MVYGSGEERLLNALAALKSAATQRPVAAAASDPDPSQQPWVWLCEKCSDPECEHRLFSVDGAALTEHAGPTQWGADSPGAIARSD